MGLSKKAFEATGGFSTIHPGEDPDLSIRLWKMGFETALFVNAQVFHERRISWKLFFKQVKKFGKVRVVLNKWHPATSKVTYWFPTVFLLLGSMASACFILGRYYFIVPFIYYLAVIVAHSAVKNGLKVGLMSAFAAVVQFTGYGWGFLNSYIQINIRNRNERKAFPDLFFEK
jgi:GT2 family glycosyltransferase